MPAHVSRRAGHTSPSTYEHGPSEKVGASDDATFGRLSICGATRWVQIHAGFEYLADPKA